MKTLARFSVRRRWYVLVAWIVLFIGLNIIAQVTGSAFSNSFSLPGTNSTHALQLLSLIHICHLEPAGVALRVRRTASPARAAMAQGYGSLAVRR